MKRKTHALYDLLEAIGVETEFDNPKNAYWTMKPSRCLHRDEMFEMCVQLGLDPHPDVTVAEMRELLDDEFDLGYENKSYESEFTVRNYQKLRREVMERKLLQVDDLSQSTKAGDEVRINGETYTVEKAVARTETDEWQVEEYAIGYLDDGRRHVLLYGYSGRRFSDTFIEKNSGSELYPRWNFSEYIEEFEV